MKPCRYCKKPFEPKFSSLEVCCSPPCAIGYARESTPDRLERQRKRAELYERREHRRALKEWRAQNKPVAKLLKEAQKEFNKFVRERDFGRPCICCGKYPPPSDVLRGHSMDAGHYRSVGAAPHLRFNEDNAHAQAVNCNRDKSGNTVEYRKRLIEKIGLARVEALENDNSIRRWDRDELILIRRKYLGKWKALRGAREARQAA